MSAPVSRDVWCTPRPPWALLLIALCLALLSSVTAMHIHDMESSLDPFEKELDVVMFSEDQHDEDLHLNDFALLDVDHSVTTSKYSTTCDSKKLGDLQNAWNTAETIAKARMADAKDPSKNALASAPKPTTVKDDDLMCYYASPEYNLKGFKEKGDAACDGGFKLSSPPITSTKLSDQQLNDIKKKIFDLVAASTTNVRFDVATLHSVEVVPRTSTNQRVILFLLDREKGCAYPVAHVVIPETAKVPHTEKILADLNMFSRDMMVDIAAKHYTIDTAKIEKFSSILYSYYAPCEDCSKVVIDTWKNEADNFGRHSVLYNQAKCNGKSYEAQHQRLCMANADDAHRHASQQVVREVPKHTAGAPLPTADRNPISALKTGEETAELAIEAYKEAVKKKESTEDAKKLALSAVESVATACYYAKATKKAVTTEISDTENKRAKHNSRTKPYKKADARIARLNEDLDQITKKPYADQAKTIIQNILKVNVLSQNEVLTKFAEFNADSVLAKELVTSSTSAPASTSNTQQGTVTKTQQSTLARTSSNLSASSPAKNLSKGGTIRKKPPVSTDSESESDSDTGGKPPVLRQIKKINKNKRQKFLSDDTDSDGQ